MAPTSSSLGSEPSSRCSSSRRTSRSPRLFAWSGSTGTGLGPQVQPPLRHRRVRPHHIGRTVVRHNIKDNVQSFYQDARDDHLPRP